MKVTNVYDIKEYVKVDDDHSSIRGYVVMKDSEGRVLFEKNNMIVSAGREIIKDLVYENLFPATESETEPATSSEKKEFSKFSEIRFGNGREITASNMEGLEKVVPTTITVTKDGEETTKTVYTVATTVDSEEDKCIKLTSTLKVEDNKESFVISEAGIFLKDRQDNYTMFSRVVFAPLTLKARQTYTLNYYIYF